MFCLCVHFQSKLLALDIVNKKMLAIIHYSVLMFYVSSVIAYNLIYSMNILANYKCSENEE